MKNLEKMLKQGFKYTERIYADLPVYESKTEYILYDKQNDSIHMRYAKD